MRYKIAIILLVLLSLGFQNKKCDDKKKETSMNDQILSVKVNCRDNEQCFFEGKDIFLDIKIFNNEDVEIGFPLEFVKSKGPITRLIDNRTGADTFIPTHPPNGDLMEKFTTIKPGEFLDLEWVITAEELQQYGADVDVSIEITIMADVLVKGKKVEFKGNNTRRIVNKNRPVS
jgi:hypothetical protein